jgi:3-oxoacyl-[acyl-carrier-protein] synthase II
MKTYISGMGNISPQKTFDNRDFLSDLKLPNTNLLSCIEPDNYEQFIDARLLRRMSRIIRMSYTAAKICLDDARIKVPDAIITGSGMGCLEDTEKFLNSIYENDEKLLPPTPFIQSTHNTIGAQIALMLQCTNYNLTYSQRGASFENALSDALMLLNESAYQQVLVGGFDEMTPNQMVLYNRLGFYKKEIVANLKLFESGTPGTLAGEGNAFFLLSSEEKNESYAVLRDVDFFNYPADTGFIIEKTNHFLHTNQLTAREIGLCIGGYNGDTNLDKIYNEVFSIAFKNTPRAAFKHLCGEYHTASSFALWLAGNILRRNYIPEAVRLTPVRTGLIKNILIYNHYRNRNHSLILLTSCR